MRDEPDNCPWCGEVSMVNHTRAGKFFVFCLSLDCNYNNKTFKTRQEAVADHNEQCRRLGREVL